MAISGSGVEIKSRTTTTINSVNWQNPTPLDSGRKALGCMLRAQHWL
jgi:chorismate-pyruvate lyase